MWGSHTEEEGAQWEVTGGRGLLLHKGVVVSPNMSLQVTAPVAGEVTVVASVRLDSSVDQEVPAESATAGEVTATSTAQESRGEL